MDWRHLDSWLNRTDLPVLAAILFGAMCAAAAIGLLLQRSRRNAAVQDGESGQEGYIVSAVLGLLALLLGFTFSLAVDRFDARRLLVLEEANAIGTAYLRSQLLAEPHRARMSDLLVRYTDNRIALAKARPASTAQQQLLAVNDALITDIWAGTSAAFDSIKGLDFSSAYLDSVNLVIDLDASRRTARAARVPTEVFVVLFVYLVTTAGVLGYVLKGMRGRLAAGFLLALLTLSLILIMDINRPAVGGISESQRAMEELRKSLATQSPAVFDRWRAAVPATIAR
ncbi:hypothetical protein LJR219_000236 [Phenylobacterium sp. LjRoot219]|uniref:bestrophin-like domain n=1 Tax=Phenylobacterium sp. LjRoot219 TaxID=3342283 RepID=UPI003ECF4DAB